MAPTDAEGMAGGVGVDLVAFGGGEIVGGLQQASAERDDLVVGARRVVDVEIEMDLLRRTVRPVGRHVVGCKLHTDPPLAVGVDDAVPVVVGRRHGRRARRPRRRSRRPGRLRRTR